MIVYETLNSTVRTNFAAYQKRNLVYGQKGEHL